MRALPSTRLRSGVLTLAVLAAGMLVAPGCAVEDTVDSTPFACQYTAECLPAFYCDRVAFTCVRGSEPDARAADQGSGTDASGADASGAVDEGLRPDGSTRPDGSSGPDGEPYPDGAASQDAATDATPDDQWLPDEGVEPGGCDLAAEPFTDCSAQAGPGAVCIRGACCPFDEISARCNATRPGFRSPPNPWNGPTDRFEGREDPPMGQGPGADQRLVVLDHGTGLLWTYLMEPQLELAGADRACRALNSTAGVFPEHPDQRFRLPDAYELWSLLSSAPVSRVAFRLPDWLIDRLGIVDEGRERQLFPTRTTSGQDEFYAVHFLSREAQLVGATGALPPDVQLRALCVAGGHSPTGPIDAARAVPGPGEGGWADPWSGLTWQFLEVLPIINPGTNLRETLATVRFRCGPGRRLPTVADVISRLDLRGGPNGLQVFDWLSGLSPASDIPILAADPDGGGLAVVAPQTALVSPIERAAVDARPKLYCLGPTNP